MISDAYIWYGGHKQVVFFFKKIEKKSIKHESKIPRLSLPNCVQFNLLFHPLRLIVSCNIFLSLLIGGFFIYTYDIFVINTKLSGSLIWLLHNLQSCNCNIIWNKKTKIECCPLVYPWLYQTLGRQWVRFSA